MLMKGLELTDAISISYGSAQDIFNNFLGMRKLLAGWNATPREKIVLGVNIFKNI